MDNNTLILIYGIYGTVAIGLVIWLARTLFTNGTVFLEDVFTDKPGMAVAVNRLLVIGFYMLNLGYALLLLPGGSRPATNIEATELLIRKLGILLASLGVIHFINMYVFWKIRQRREIDIAEPPVPHRSMTAGVQEG